MKTLTAGQMREADRRCIQELGLPGAVLMDHAGRAVFNEVERGPVGVVCGKGNNGGDGFVVARYALAAGHDVRLLLIADPADIKGDAAIFMQAYLNLGGAMTHTEDPAEAAHAVEQMSDCAVLVDAMLGTGITGQVRDPFRSVIEAWPAVDTIAVDLPSGLDADTGEPGGCCVRAAVTVTFQFAKNGFTSPSAAPYLGRLVVADIGIPAVCADDEAWRTLRKRLEGQ